MRCPNCGGINVDQAQLCVRCGTALLPAIPPAQRRPPYQQPPQQRPMPPNQGSPRPVAPQTAPPPYQQPPQQRPMPPAPPMPKNVSAMRGGRPSTPAATTPITPTAPQAPEPPAPFPPRTMVHLQALEPGALLYTISQDSVAVGSKKIVRIIYQRCSAWQQVATLLKAFKELKADAFNTVIVQGVLEQDVNAYTFTNGQLVFDRNVRLGSQTINRYQIETGTGFEIDSVRIVLSE